MPFDVAKIRRQFPALAEGGLFLDNPGGTQAVKNCLDRILDYLVSSNANHGGVFRTGRESDALLDKSRAETAEFLNAAGPEEIVFGQNMTTLTFHLSRSLARLLGPGDRVVVTRLDHDANVSPWLLAAADRGAEVVWVDFHPEDGTLDLESFGQALERKPKLVAFGYASNALGTINPAAELAARARRAGALVYIDAVHFAPHGPIDVRALGCDFLVCSAYKFFGPHLGVLWGRADLLRELFAYKVRPAPDELPGRFETGTQNHEAIAGLLGTLEYLEWLGNQAGPATPPAPGAAPQGKAAAFKRAMAAVKAYEQTLSRAMLEALKAVPGLKLYGSQDPGRLDERVPTFAFRLDRLAPRRIAELLDHEGIYVWDGNYYALEVTRRLGVEDSGGMVRAGAVHYNTAEEIRRFGAALHKIAAA